MLKSEAKLIEVFPAANLRSYMGLRFDPMKLVSVSRMRLV